jgi:hypothetical protein
VYYLGAIIQNASTGIIQAIYYTGGAHTTIVGGSGGTIWDVLLALINQLGTILSGLTNGLPAAIASVFQSVASVLNSLLALAVTLVNAVLTVAFLLYSFALMILTIGLGIVGDIINLFSIIPAIIGGFTQAFSAASYGAVSVGQLSLSGAYTPGTVPGKLDCTDPVLYHACVGLYVLDNTIFNGSPSLLGILLQVAIGVWFVSLLIWAVRKFQHMSVP